MRPDYHRIHQLEFDLGLRDDPPPPQITDEPGAIISYSGSSPCWVIRGRHEREAA